MRHFHRGKGLVPGAGLKLGCTCWPIWHTDPQNNPDMTHIRPICDPHAEVFFLKVMHVAWHKTFNMEQCLTLGRIQNRSLELTSSRWNLCTPHASKQLETISWFKPMTYQMPTCFLKNMWYPDNLVTRWDPLDPQKVTQCVWVIRPTFNSFLEACRLWPCHKRRTASDTM